MEQEVDFTSTLPENEQRKCFFCFQLCDFDINNGIKIKTERKTASHIRSEVSRPEPFSSLQNLFRYLEIDSENTKEMESDTKSICKACAKLLQLFSLYFQVWEDV